MAYTKNDIKPKFVNGVAVEMTDEEIQLILNDWNAWESKSGERKLAEIRTIRNKLLQDTDFHALSDNTMSAEMTTYRQELRDITEGITTVEQANAVVFPTKP